MIPIFYPNLNQEMESLLFGALFHDIGKFWQRTRDNIVKKEVEKEYEWQISDLGRSRAAHEQWSAFFLKKYLKHETAELIALRHHHPENYLEYLVAVADKLSASEREEETEATGKKDVSREPLQSILSSVKINHGPKQAAYKPLRFKVEYPNPVKEKESAVKQGDYQAYWDEFCNNINRAMITIDEEWKRFHVLYQLLEDYTVSVPSAAYYSKSTISLFDHSKTTAAIAVALFKNNFSFEKIVQVHNALKGNASKDILQEDAFLLLGADISGIQDFVFDLTAKGAAKGLKGRSYYISALSENIARYILSGEGLSPVNLLFSGGGHFYLLLPLSASERIGEYRNYINKVLYTACRGRLSVVLAGTILSFASFSASTFGERWLNVAALLQREKNRKYLDLIKHQPELILGPHWEGDSVCKICGNPVEADEDKCTFCQSYEELGEDLAKNSRYLIEQYIKPEFLEPLTRVEDVFAAFGCRFRFSNTPPKEPEKDTLTATVNGEDFISDRSQRRAWLSNAAPLDEHGRLKTFEEIASASQGIKTWAVLRGDVDNLGLIFSKGLGEDRTISAVSSLSREVAYFFSTQINFLCSRYRDQVYVIYAGGDDFFVVGSWNILPALAREIQRAFWAYGAQNPDLTLSCSVSLSPQVAFPLFKVAQKAGHDLDELAKTIRVVEGKVHSKDSIAFLGKAFTWEEIDEVEKLKELIKESIQHGASKALIHNIYRASGDYAEYQSGEYPLHRVWRLAYSLTRLAQRHRQAAPYIKEVENRVITSQHLFQKNSVYAARWAEFELRTGGN